VRWIDVKANHTIDRRLFLASALLIGCGPRSPRRTSTSASVVPPPPTDVRPYDGYPTSSDTPSTSCALTHDNIEGPFFKPGAPERHVLADHGPGMRLRVGGVVRDAWCRPLAGARMDVWQADHRGAYDNVGFGMRASMRTGDDGSYGFDTIVPGRYLNGDRYRPAHIHVKLSATGHAPLTTQLYFPDDPYNEGDPFIVRELIMALVPDDHRGVKAAFDFVLRAT
jgi:protocatechuate 3,4-dioxygenase beta subunit